MVKNNGVVLCFLFKYPWQIKGYQYAVFVWVNPELYHPVAAWNQRMVSVPELVSVHLHWTPWTKWVYTQKWRTWTHDFRPVFHESYPLLYAQSYPRPRCFFANLKGNVKNQHSSNLKRRNLIPKVVWSSNSAYPNRCPCWGGKWWSTTRFGYPVCMQTSLKTPILKKSI